MIKYVVVFLLLGVLVIVAVNTPKRKPAITESAVTTVADTKTLTPEVSNKKKRDMMGQYSFGLSVCEEVKKELVSEVIGKPIVETKDHSDNSTTGCQYFTDKEKAEHILVNVVFLSAENQKKGQETLGRTIKTDPSIPMDHFIAWQEDNNLINAVYLVSAPEKFVRIDRTSAGVATNEQLITLAQKVAEIILYE